MSWTAVFAVWTIAVQAPSEPAPQDSWYEIDRQVIETLEEGRDVGDWARACAEIRGESTGAWMRTFDLAVRAGQTR